jgi:hypothetical protein
MWYFTVASEEYGTEEYGPYETKKEAQAGIDRVAEEAIDINDDVLRRFTLPYQRSERESSSIKAIDKKALMGAIVAVSDRYGMGITDILELLTAFLGYGDTGVLRIVPKELTVKELQTALVDILREVTGGT